MDLAARGGEVAVEVGDNLTFLLFFLILAGLVGFCHWVSNRYTDDDADD